MDRIGWRRRRQATMAGILVALAAGPGAAAQDGAVIRLTRESGREIGVACRYLDLDQRAAPPEATMLCDAAAELVTRMVSDRGRSVVHLGLRTVALDAEPTEELPPTVDGPILLLVLEGRRDWSGTAHPRLLLRARPVRGGVAAPSVGLPPIPVELAGEGWRAAADRALERVVGFALRDG
ncbi:hypothetical protein [Azospirillum lipoferum]|uniref:Uncharacterized protein n=1 Tax=Azospirillum lipoferum (strain 4B) TaxID=862719 RepID=G7Z9A0_AZOL4|nr:hypothetical protein [Azospirillum lipoferum]CBS86039.1 exported protein of unknown function [Azospirillum lipoferum 4B]